MRGSQKLSLHHNFHPKQAFPASKDVELKRRATRDPRHRGEHYETVAGQYLESQGLKALAKNYSCRLGEIDLVMLDSHRSLIFIEVKFRNSSKFGQAIEMVGPSKQRKIRLAAAHYLQKHTSLQKLNCRFDVIGITGQNSKMNFKVEWIKNAFS